jgi:hypothetical protein
MKRAISIAILLAAFSSLAISVPLQGKSQGRGRGETTKDDANHGLVFGSAEIRIIKEWFASPANLSGLPPGLAKREKLPPGLSKQLQRNGTLPPGLQKKVQPLPHGLEVRLPKLPDGHRRVILSGTVILLDTKMNRILDLVSNVL